MRTPEERIAAERDVIARAQPRVVLDVGAHVGGMTQMFLDLGAQLVVCVEPIPDIYAQLTTRFAQDERVWTRNVAVTDEEDLAREGGLLKNQTVFNCYTLQPHGFSGLESSPEYRNKPTFQVQLSTIDRIALALRPDFLKIDVDGYEPRAMRGAQQTIQLTRPVIMLEISYLPKILGDSCEAMVASMFSNDYIAESMFDGRVFTSAAEFMPAFPWHTSFDVVLWPSNHPGRPA
jgi:FkbM family methyltransferase